MTDSTPRFSVGDKVVLVRQRREPIETEVTKVGRKYFWVADSYRYQKFSLETGREVTEYGTGDYVTTPELQAESRRRKELIAALRDAGVRFDWQSRELSSETLTRILAAVLDDAGGDA